ncbi:MAG: hydrogenase maturation nickel metallochaperone HypA [Candidatus Omnitrophica bacterium]|nr:hydrogenase maturation nickel metallochaperone HypA [Candidatus Omnitrophota bacterium]
MHDLRYASQILAAVKMKTAAGSAAGPITVNVRLSPFSHVRPEGLEETFRLLAENEGYRNVKLNINILEFNMHCRMCGRDSRHGGAVFACPHCKGQDFDIEKGDEFYIDKVEVR